MTPSGWACHGGMHVVHAEDDAIASWLTAKYVGEGKTHGAYISEVRNALVEEAAIRRCMLLAERTGCALYVLHIAAGSGVAALAEGRSKGLPFYGETLSCYLSFTQDELWDEGEITVGDRTYPRRGLLFNNYPSIKTAADRELLWEAIADGRLDVVATDHCLIDVADRYQLHGAELPFPQGGQAAVELRLPLLYSSGVVPGRIGVSRFVELASTAPAKLLGLWPQKGEIAAGADADIVVFDPAKVWTVDWRDNLHMSAPYSCWQGWELTGKARTTILRGSVLVEDESWVGSTTGGRFLERKLLPEVVGPAPDLDFVFQARQAAVTL